MTVVDFIYETLWNLGFLAIFTMYVKWVRYDVTSLLSGVRYRLLAGVATLSLLVGILTVVIWG